MAADWFASGQGPTRSSSSSLFCRESKQHVGSRSISKGGVEEEEEEDARGVRKFSSSSSSFFSIEFDLAGLTTSIDLSFFFFFFFLQASRVQIPHGSSLSLSHTVAKITSKEKENNRSLARSVGILEEFVRRKETTGRPPSSNREHTHTPVIILGTQLVDSQLPDSQMRKSKKEKDVNNWFCPVHAILLLWKKWK